MNLLKWKKKNFLQNLLILLFKNFSKVNKIIVKTNFVTIKLS